MNIVPLVSISIVAIIFIIRSFVLGRMIWKWQRLYLELMKDYKMLEAVINGDYKTAAFLRRTQSQVEEMEQAEKEIPPPPPGAVFTQQSV